jgi:hypothetical protein
MPACDQRCGRRDSRVSTIACLTVPFYLHDRHNFGPLEAASRLFVFNELLPQLGVALIVLMAALAAALSFTQMDAAALFRNCALVQAFPVMAGVVLSTLQDGQLNLGYARYGPFFAWFALRCCGGRTSSSNDSCGSTHRRSALRCEDLMIADFTIPKHCRLM